MIYIVARPKLPEDEEVAAAPPTAKAQTAQPMTAVASPSPADEIVKLAALKEFGAITAAEFDAAKAKALA